MRLSIRPAARHLPSPCRRVLSRPSRRFLDPRVPSEAGLHDTGPAGYRTAVTMFGDMRERDRTRWGLRPARAAWLLGVDAAEFRELEAGTRWPSFETYDRICKLFGWPQVFVSESGQVEYRW
jgi:hypothetical protein